MSVIIRKANSRAEIDDVLSLRYEALLKTNRKPHTVYDLTKKISDAFDVYQSTIHIIGQDQGNICLSARLIEFKQSISIVDPFFDFNNLLKQLEGACFYLDMLCFQAINWDIPTLFKELLSFSALTLHTQNVKGLLLLCPSNLASELASVNGEIIGNEIQSQAHDDTYLPCYIEINKFYESWSAKVNDKEILRFQESFFKTLFHPGEVLILQGERGGSAFLIEQGSVEVLIESGENIKNVGTIDQGNLVGEMAMLTGEKRTASVMSSCLTICLGFDRAPFMSILEQSPQRVVDVFKLFSKRVTNANRLLTEAWNKSEAR